MQTKSALLLGASGLVGQQLLQILLDQQQYDRIVVLVRRSLQVNHAKLEEHVIEFEQLSKYGELLTVDDVYCCLGTTIKKAQSERAFRRIDVDTPLQLATMAKEKGVRQFLVITAMGADRDSCVFYSRMKGILEEELKALQFVSLFIFRPSLLLGDRQEFRLGEKVASWLSRLLVFMFIGPLRKYRPIHAATVATAMFHAGQDDLPGIHIYRSDLIQKRGASQ